MANLEREVQLKFGGRFLGLYLIEELLYETDKHAHENLFMLSAFLATHGANKEDIRDIYVLGHSMSPPDLEYFIFLMDATRINDSVESEDELEELADLDPMNELDTRINYAIQHYGYKYASEQTDPRQDQVMALRLKQEQAAQQEWMEKEFSRTMGIQCSQCRSKKGGSPIQKQRTEDDMWHLSYFKDSNRAWKETLLQELKCKRYELLPTIDACLEKFHT